MSTKVKWDERADLQLLLAVISVHEVKIDYAAVTAALGFGCSTRAVEERLKKIKKKARTASGSTITDTKAAVGMATTDIATILTKKRKAPVSVLASQKKAKKDDGPEAVEDEFDDYDDDDEEEGGVKLEMEGETKFEHSDTQGCGLLLEEGLLAEIDENDDQMCELLPYEEEESVPRVV